MKLTREQVSQLSDAELDLAMIWCYPPDTRLTPFYETYITHKPGDDQAHCIKYLKDWSLTGPLMIKNRIESTPFTYSDCGEWRVCQIKRGVNRYSINKNPLRAICEVLLMIAMEREA